MQDKSLREKLIQLGLSDYESRVYLAVVESPDSIASVIAKRGEVPRSKVYEVLYRLIDKGLVYQSESGKKRFLAIDPIAGFNILQTIYRKESQEKIKLFSEVPLLISSMLDSNIVVNDVASNVRTITDLKELAYYITICLEESRSEILTFSKDCSALISIELPSIYKPLINGVKVKSIYETSHIETIDSFKSVMQFRSLGEENKITEKLPFRMYIFDNRRAVIVMSYTKSGSRELQYRSVVVEQKELILSYRILFDLFWQIADELIL